jgi:peptide/nickel transport system substrate-binding protein
MVQRFYRMSLVFVLGTLIASCASPSPSSSNAPSGGASSAAISPTAAPVPQTPKVLTIAIQNELKGFVAELSLENTRVGGVRQPKPIAHNLLTVENERGEFLPELATEQISVERGTWKVEPDGTMETTWRIRPNAKWHDGTPFTSADLLFSWQVFTDPAIPNAVAATARQMAAATAPDAQTLVVRWSGLVIEADQAPGLVPLPRHLLEESYRGDKSTFANNPKLSTEFVGLGPYKLAIWEPGSHAELVRFDDYWRGRPPLDRVVVRFVGDPNTMVANILAEAVDVVLPPAVDFETALEVRRRWEGTGHQVLAGPSGGLRMLDMQLRPDLARPRNGFVQRSVRQAFTFAMDRQTLADVLTGGLGPVADSWYRPTDPLRAQVESSIPQYPYDQQRAQQLLAQSGWTRGSDGILVHQPSGERFEVQLDGTSQRRVQQELNIIADGWKAAGAVVTLYSIPPALGNDVEHRASQPGAGVRIRFPDVFHIDYPHSRGIPSAQNRWVGSNYGGYSNPQADSLLDRLSKTVNPAERLPIQRALVQEVMTDVALWPLYWDMTSVLALKGVKGIPNGEGPYQTWNFFQWDVDAGGARQ